LAGAKFSHEWENRSDNCEFAPDFNGGYVLFRISTPPYHSRPERFLVALALWPARSALLTSALKRSSTWLSNLASRFTAERTEARIERIPRWLQDFNLYRLDWFNAVAGGVPLPARLSAWRSF
jgi:hypothetical protein